MEFFDRLTYNVHWTTKKRSSWESAIYHSIKPPFDAEVAQKFLNGIYYIISLWSLILANTDVLTDPFCIKVTNKADIWALGIVLYQWAYNEKHPYETLPGGKISRIKGGLISELFFLGSNPPNGAKWLSWALSS